MKIIILSHSLINKIILKIWKRFQFLLQFLILKDDMQALLITQFKKMCNSVNMILTKTKGTSCSILVTYVHPKSCAKNCKQNNVWCMTVVAWYISLVEKFIIYYIKAVSTEVSWHFHCMPASSSWSAPFSAEEWMQGSCLLLHSVHC